MDITPVTSVAIPTIKLNALAPIDAKAALIIPLAASALPEQSASLVNFSTLAQLLAATVIFQTQQAKQAQQLSANAVTSTDFGQLAATATLFVNAFNTFQLSSADSLVNPFGSAFDNALLLAIHAKNTQPGLDNTQSFIDSLAQVGIHFQDATDPTHPNQFKIDSTALELAFKANPTQTATLLANAFQALSAIEEKLVLSQTTQGLNLFSSDTNPALNERVPASQFDTNVVAQQLSSLSSADAQKVNVALQRLLVDEALSEAVGANPIAPHTVANSAAVATNPVENIPTTAPVVSLAAGTAADNLLTENPAFAVNAISQPELALPQLTTPQVAAAINVNNALATSPL